MAKKPLDQIKIQSINSDQQKHGVKEELLAVDTPITFQSRNNKKQ